MALFEKKRRTSQQKAQRAQMGILARLLGCGYLIYIMVQLIQTTREEGATDVALKLTIAGFFLLASAVIIVITALEFLRSLKLGVYKPTFYSDDFASEEASGSEDASENEEVTEDDNDGENNEDAEYGDDDAEYSGDQEDEEDETE